MVLLIDFRDVPGSETIEHCARPEFISDMLHRNNGPLGSVMANADVSRVEESHCIPLIGVDQMLMTDRVRRDLWAQLYKDLFSSSSNWEKIDRPH